MQQHWIPFLIEGNKMISALHKMLSDKLSDQSLKCIDYIHLSSHVTSQAVSFPSVSPDVRNIGNID